MNEIKLILIYKPDRKKKKNIYHPAIHLNARKEKKKSIPLEPTLHLVNALINKFTSLYIKMKGTDKFKQIFLTEQNHEI